MAPRILWESWNGKCNSRLLLITWRRGELLQENQGIGEAFDLKDWGSTNRVAMCWRVPDRGGSSPRPLAFTVMRVTLPLMMLPGRPCERCSSLSQAPCIRRCGRPGVIADDTGIKE